MILVFDTETTGKVDFRAPASAKHQPRMVQLAAVLAENDGRVRGEINLIIEPDGFEIPEEASDIHGITTEIARRCGVPARTAVRAFEHMAECADTLVAYNADFDVRILEREACCIEEIFPDKLVHCAMKACTHMVGIPGPYGYKWPKLSEAHQFFFGSAHEGAHDALADVRATLKVHLATMARLAPEVPRKEQEVGI